MTLEDIAFTIAIVVFISTAITSSCIIFYDRKNKDKNNDKKN